ncbi:hypothetical protein D3C80_1305730 [compost metagenome]
MVGQDEDGDVVGRVVPPPAFPVLVRPLPAQRAEHVAPQNPGADIAKAAGGEIIVQPGRAAVLAEQGLLEGARGEQPLVQRFGAHAQRILEVLVRAGPVSVE